MTQICYFNE